METKQFYTRLEGLRGIAVLLVMISHWVVMLYFPKFLFLDLGFWGVNIFFVLSGFLITEILLKSIYDSESRKKIIKRFYLRRLIRIFPIYYLVIFLLAFFKIENTEELLPWSLTYSLNLTDQGRYILIHIWSLCVEEQFYLLWPFLLLIVPPQRHLHLILGLILLSVAFRFTMVFLGYHSQSGILRSFPLSCLDALAIGSLLALIKTRYKIVHLQIARYYGIGLGIALLFFMMAFLLPKESIWNASLGRFLIAFTGFFLIAFGSTDVRGRIGIVFENKILRYIGKISYGVYLYHWVIFVLLIDAFKKYWVEMDFGWLGFLRYHQYLGVFTAFTALTLLIASLSYYCIERPILKLKHRFS